MSTFQYGLIKLHPIYTHSFQRKVVYHGPTYLWTECVLRVQGIYNPKLVSYHGDIGFPVLNAGSTPPMTDQSIRHVLKQPRQQLIFTTGPADPTSLEPAPAGGVNRNFPALSSPKPPKPADKPGNLALAGVAGIPQLFTTDCNWGPLPISSSVDRITGTDTWWVSFAVKVHLNECFHINNRPPFVLSHRWVMTHDIDEDHFTTRTIEGRVIFRTDVMAQQKLVMDDYRAAFFHPVPDNFRRMQANVYPTERGNEYFYAVTDEEQSHNIINPNVTRIEAFATIGVKKPSPMEAAFGAILEAAGGIAGEAANVRADRRIAGPRGGRLIPGRAFRTAGAAVAAISTGIKGFIGAMPVSSVKVTARVWGNRNIRRSELIDVANNILLLKLPLATNDSELRRLFFGRESGLSMNLMGRYVEATATLIGGPYSAAAGSVLPSVSGAAVSVATPALGGGLGPIIRQIVSSPIVQSQLPTTVINNMKDAQGVFPQLWDDELTDGANLQVATVQDKPGKSFPKGHGTRGTYVAQCIAQALQSPCMLPDYPTAQVAADDEASYTY